MGQRSALCKRIRGSGEVEGSAENIHQRSQVMRSVIIGSDLLERYEGEYNGKYSLAVLVILREVTHKPLANR